MVLLRHFFLSFLLHPVDPTENLMSAEVLGRQGKWATALPVLARERPLCC
jgi:hypothetical protein